MEKSWLDNNIDKLKKANKTINCLAIFERFAIVFWKWYIA